VPFVSGPLDLTIVYERGEDGWIVVSIPQIPGVFSQGHTRGEARGNVIDALR
jgi:predicted RNase H-like HicB family nuclease